MTPADLIKALRELEQFGWPIEVAPKAGISDSPHVAFVEPEAGHIGGLNISLHEPLPWDAEALVCGWALACLEARGLRREVFWKYDGTCLVVVCTEDVTMTPHRAVRDTELAALLAACLSLAEAT